MLPSLGFDSSRSTKIVGVLFGFKIEHTEEWVKFHYSLFYDDTGRNTPQTHIKFGPLIGKMVDRKKQPKKWLYRFRSGSSHVKNASRSGRSITKKVYGIRKN